MFTQALLNNASRAFLKINHLLVCTCAPRCCKLSILPPKNLNYIFCPRMLQAIVYPPSNQPLTWLRRRTIDVASSPTSLQINQNFWIYICLHMRTRLLQAACSPSKSTWIYILLLRRIWGSLPSLQIILNIYLIAQVHLRQPSLPPNQPDYIFDCSVASGCCK